MTWWGKGAARWKGGGEGVGAAKADQGFEAGGGSCRESWFDSHPGPQTVPEGWVPIGGRGPLSVLGSCWSWNGCLQLGPILTSAPGSTWLR